MSDDHDDAAGPTRPRFEAERDPRPPAPPQPAEPETGGPGGPEPTRYGDWTVKGRCIDF